VLLSLSQQGGTCPLSEIRVTTVSATNGTGPVTLTKQYAAKAWVNFNNSTAIQDSENVASLTDVATGSTTVTYTNALGNGNYCVQYTTDGVHNGNASSLGHGDSDNSGVLGTGSVRVQCRGADGNPVTIDAVVNCVLIHGDLA